MTATEVPLVDYEVANGVCTVTLSDLQRRNALSRQLVAELNAALDRAESDDQVRVIVLTNQGRVFCAGADLSERSGTADDDGSPAARSDPARLFARFASSPKPYVGRIAGHCVAGGMGLAAAMDIAIAVDDAKMGFTEVRIGVAPAMISVLCLPKMRTGDARDAILRGRRFPATEAARMGLINQAVPAAELDAAVNIVVQDLLAAGPAALAASKQLLARVPTLATDEALAWTAKLSAELFASPEAAEGMAAYLAKRPPSWVSRDDQPATEQEA